MRLATSGHPAVEITTSSAPTGSNSAKRNISEPASLWNPGRWTPEDLCQTLQSVASALPPLASRATCVVVRAIISAGVRLLPFLVPPAAAEVVLEEPLMLVVVAPRVFGCEPLRNSAEGYSPS